MHRSLFVGNIPYGSLESEIHTLFSAHGSVHDVHFVMDHKQGRFRGFGFVRMAEADAAKAVSMLNGTEFQGRRLIVREARENASATR
ncbi:MAG: RNA-binding protein [Oceanipulchritudo sp.]